MTRIPTTNSKPGLRRMLESIRDVLFVRYPEGDSKQAGLAAIDKAISTGDTTEYLAWLDKELAAHEAATRESQEPVGC